MKNRNTYKPFFSIVFLIGLMVVLACGGAGETTNDSNEISASSGIAPIIIDLPPSDEASSIENFTFAIVTTGCYVGSSQPTYCPEQCTSDLMTDYAGWHMPQVFLEQCISDQCKNPKVLTDIPPPFRCDISSDGETDFEGNLVFECQATIPELTACDYLHVETGPDDDSTPLPPGEYAQDPNDPDIFYPLF